jgi:hypothetical protein
MAGEYVEMQSVKTPNKLKVQAFDRCSACEENLSFGCLVDVVRPSMVFGSFASVGLGPARVFKWANLLTVF